MAARKRSKTAPRRPKPLTPVRIVEAALKLADGRGEFSMRALGGRLGVDPMAIYRHFRDKDALIDAMVDAVLADFEPPAPDAAPPAEQLREMCLELRTAIARHPGIGLRASTTLLTLGPHSLELTEAALDLLRQMGLDAEEAALAYLALMRFVTGTSSAEDHLRAAGQEEDEWHEEVRRAYANVSPERFPGVRDMADTLAARGFDEQFAFGIDVLLAGIAARGSRSD